ncbi:alpha/beta hydrolase family protein [Paenibacillus durus]|uniref:Acetylhydrolase n=1 Tax=Paenibacillus durus ATCC 35681 TaxID=1333534 RepID=A0A0F7F826_PAEDU|nr:alpha/beta fold hydrolase [Paenibacillus durus]AKG34189.1 hypothetical protein VK70_06030 [Paenibacillus durus ATCC 35681]
MRLFEILLIVLNLFFLTLLAFGRLRSKRSAALAAAVSLTAISLHLALEGYRFQMWPAYVISAVLAIHAAVRFSRGSSSVQPPVKRSKLRRTGITAFLLVYSLLTALPPFALPVPSFEKPTGSYNVGTVQYHWIDPSRKETYENVPGNNRALNVQIWYPADHTEGVPAAPYVADLPVIAEALGKQYGIPKQLFSYFNLAKTYAYQEPPVSKRETAYPVIVFSHGFPGGRYTNTFQTVELASHGFIVVAVEHTLSSFTTVFPGGHYIGLSPNQPKPSDIPAWDDIIDKVWLNDIRFVLDRLEDLNRRDDKKLLTGALDLSRIGMLGHSFGGANAAQALLLDQRVKAAINMDGTFFGKGDLSRGLPRPFLLMSSDLPPQPAGASAEPTDSQLAAAGLTRELFDKQLRQIPLRKQEALRNGGKELIIPHATHLSFCDFYLWFPMMVWTNGQTEDPHRTHRTINKATVAFFEEHLGQK